MVMEKFTSFDGSVLHLTVWDIVKEPRGVVQILHGVAEHMRRYAGFASFLNENGYIVAGEDHRAHGETSGADKLGIAVGETFSDTVSDALAITDHLKSRYNLPVIIFGHSYGSFLAQGYLQRRNADIAGFVLSGSADMSGALVVVGKLLAAVACAFRGRDSKARLLQNMTVGGNDKGFPGEGKNAWLSRDPAVSLAYNSDEMCGFTNTNGFYREMLKGLSKLYSKKGLANIGQNVKIYMFSGAADPVGGSGKLTDKLYDRYKALGISPKYKLYAEGRHEMLNETNKEEVYSDCLEFFDACI